MSAENEFFLIVLGTVLTTRTLLFFYPVPTPKIGSFRPHHWMVGLLIGGIGILFSSLVVYAIGFGLFIDELTYVLMRGRSHEDNYSIISLAGTVIFISLTFVFRGYLVALG